MKNSNTVRNSKLKARKKTSACRTVLIQIFFGDMQAPCSPPKKNYQTSRIGLGPSNYILDPKGQ